MAERKNCHLFEVTLALLFQKKVPKSCWEEVILTIAYLINRMQTRVLEFQTPVKRLAAFFPNFKGVGSLTPTVHMFLICAHPTTFVRQVGSYSCNVCFLGVPFNTKRIQMISSFNKEEICHCGCYCYGRTALFENTYL